MKYYYNIDNKQFGPHEAAALKEAIERGFLLPTTMVLQEGGHMWKPLAQHPELRAFLPPGAASSKPARTKVKAVPPTVSKPAPASHEAPRPHQPMVTPMVGQALQIIAAVNLFLGLIVGILYMSEAYPMSGIIGASVIIGALVASVFLYAFACLLTWVYNILLQSRRQ